MCPLSSPWSAGLLSALSAGCVGTTELTVAFVTDVNTAGVENKYYIRPYFQNKHNAKISLMSEGCQNVYMCIHEAMQYVKIQ